MTNEAEHPAGEHPEGDRAGPPRASSRRSGARREPSGQLHWGRRPRSAQAGPAPGRTDPAYREGTSRHEAIATARRVADRHGDRERDAARDNAIAKAVSVVAREAETVSSGSVRVLRAKAEKRWIDPQQPFLLVAVVVSPPGAAGWTDADLEAVRARISEMALAVPGGPRDVVVFIDKAASGAAPARRASRRG